MNFKHLTGQLDDWIQMQDLPDGVDKPIHKAVVEPFLALRQAAGNEGFDLRIVSGFRDFQRQWQIWQAKVRGERPVLDRSANPLDVTQCSKEELLFHILHWSALPGASRHHWGTDIDIYDAAAVDADYEVQLVPAETENSGPFAPLHAWLDTYLPQTDFFRPYVSAGRGVAPERWHLSYAPLANQFQQQLQADHLLELWRTLQLPLYEEVLRHWTVIWSDYICVTNNAT